MVIALKVLMSKAGEYFNIILVIISMSRLLTTNAEYDFSLLLEG